MRKLLKRKMAMCLLAASLFGKSNNSSANEQINMNQLIKLSLGVGAGAGVIGLAIVMPLIIMNSKADEKAVEKKMYQENKNKLQNLFNEQAKECGMKNIQKYWDALNKIAQEDFDDIFKEIYNYHHKERNKKANKEAKFSNARKIVGNACSFAVVNKIEGKHIETIEDCKQHLDFGFFKNIFNGKYQVKRLEILSDNSKIIFKFLTVANSTINVSFESENYGLGGKSPYENDIFTEREWTFLRINTDTTSLDLRFTDVERDFGLEF